MVVSAGELPFMGVHGAERVADRDSSEHRGGAADHER
jgi:hypothetical protein